MQLCAKTVVHCVDICVTWGHVGYQDCVGLDGESAGLACTVAHKGSLNLAELNTEAPKFDLEVRAAKEI